MKHQKLLFKRLTTVCLLPSTASTLLALSVCSATAVNAATDDAKWQCSPTQDGSNWQCTATGEMDINSPPLKTTAKLTAAQQDWIPVAQLTEAQKALINPSCCGSFIEPQRSDAEALLNPEDAPLRASAESSESVNNNIITLHGNVQLTQGYRQIQADTARLDQEQDIATLTGNLRLREPGVLMTGANATMNMATGEAQIQQASYLVHAPGIHGQSADIHLSETDILTLKQGTYSSCDADNPLWQLRGSEIEIDPNTQQGTGKNIRLLVKGVPVFYTPYIRFPVGDQRQSGFLFPAIGLSASDGLDLATPYYFNLAPNYDLTLTPRFISHRGDMLEAEARHLSSWFETDVGIGYLSSDNGGKIDKGDLLKLDTNGDPVTREDLQPFKGEDRWLLSVNQTGGGNSPWHSLIDFTRVSDVDYFRDLDISSFDANSATQLKQLGQLGYDLDHWQFTIAAEEYQTLDIDKLTPYKQLPRLTANGEYAWEDWQLSLEHEVIRFDHRNKFYDDAELDPWIIGDRAYLDYNLAWYKQWQWGFFKPQANLKHLSYQLDNSALLASANNSAAITVPQGSLDTGLFFEREGAIFGSKYIQTFEPRLFYFYSDFESHDDLLNITSRNRDVDFDTSELTFSYSQLFNDFRFSGHDRIGDDHRLSAGLTSRFIEASTGIERFSLSLGQIYYFDDRAVSLTQTAEQALTDLDNTRNTSLLAAQVTAQIYQNWYWQTDVSWDDTDADKVERASTSLSYHDNADRIINVGYQYSRRAGTRDTNDIDNDGDTTELINSDIDQADLSMVWPIAGNWNFIGRGFHDLTRQRELESMVGFEYNSCCYRMRVIARRWLDNDLINVIDDSELEYDKGIFLEFQFRGLGGTGGKVSGILDESIAGFSQREKNLR